MSSQSVEYKSQQVDGSYPPHQNQTQDAYTPEQRYAYGQPQFSHSQQGTPSHYSQEGHFNHSPSPYAHQQPPLYGENASYYHDALPSDQLPPGAEDPNGEKGIGSTVVGGAAGGYAAHQMSGGGKLATVGGALLGAVAGPMPGTTTVTTTTTNSNGLGVGGGLLVGVFSVGARLVAMLTVVLFASVTKVQHVSLRQSAVSFFRFGKHGLNYCVNL
ncbi:hypothetical protein N7462_008538 [Penicillium macrosclerotiorum]|uniref:uncharacterized protein n=1 Tax=Penicillium macrosclerotiorum TaxID=303699 RepID=UPI0025493F8C|nr:uncharacterized protein N7462_008538 [Penicillium macrosclerotiorum]KAJ5675641.1 hypothetical protein N7462_008538 [Penicillium macrosclerotiorum]